MTSYMPPMSSMGMGSMYGRQQQPQIQNLSAAINEVMLIAQQAQQFPNTPQALELQQLKPQLQELIRRIPGGSWFGGRKSVRRQRGSGRKTRRSKY
jgi:hypothetical protein